MQDILAHEQRRAMSDETMETMFPHRTTCGLWRNQPERGEGEGMHGLISRGMELKRAAEEAKKNGASGASVVGDNWADSVEGKPVLPRSIRPGRVNENRGDGASRAAAPE